LSQGVGLTWKQATPNARFTHLGVGGTENAGRDQDQRKNSCDLGCECMCFELGQVEKERFNQSLHCSTRDIQKSANFVSVAVDLQTVAEQQTLFAEVIAESVT